MPYVSVIVPCYNAASYIECCLQGLERQAYCDFDVILVDDCSNDETEEVIRQYGKRSSLTLQYYRNEQNLGPAASRKKGVELSNAKYIAFCDSDDWDEPNYLALMVEKAQENDADMVFCGYNTVFIGQRKKRTVEHKVKLAAGELHTRTALELNVDSLCVTLVKHEIINVIPIVNIRNGEDMALIPLMISSSTKFGVVKECIYNYVCRQESASVQANEKVVESLICSFEHIYSNISDIYRNECEIIGVRNLIYGGLLTLFKYSFDTKKARDILEKFEEKYPTWTRSEKINYLPLNKKIFVKLAGNRYFLFLKILSKIHMILTRNY